MELYEYEREHRDLLRRLAPECMVLLKSDGTFPLEAPCKVALYGSGARETIKGGTGSGDVNVRHYTTVEEGLENAGFTVTTKPWLESYSALRQQAHVGFVAGIKAKAKELGVPALLLGMGALKGLTVGGAQVSEKHAGFVINRGGATCADVKELIRQIQERVFAQAGVRLEPEVRIID